MDPLHVERCPRCSRPTEPTEDGYRCSPCAMRWVVTAATHDGAKPMRVPRRCEWCVHYSSASSTQGHCYFWRKIVGARDGCHEFKP